MGASRHAKGRDPWPALAMPVALVALAWALSNVPGASNASARKSGPATPTPTPTATIPNCGPDGNYRLNSTGGATMVPGTEDIGNHCDDCLTVVDFPFLYTLYDRTFVTATISPDGYLLFWPESQAVTTVCPPNLTALYAFMPYGANMRTDCPECGIYISISGSPPNRVFNIEWRTVMLSNGQSINFEARLYEGERQLTSIYQQVQFAGSTAVTAVQRDPTRYTRYTCGAGLIPGSQLIFTLPPCTTQTPTRTPRATGTPTATITATLEPTSIPSTTPAPRTDTPTPIPTETVAPTITPCTITWSDVRQGDYFYQAVRYLYCARAVSGYADGTFRPYNNMTRGQIAKVVSLAFGYQCEVCYSEPFFTDVPPDHPFYRYVQEIAWNEIMSGYADGTFRPYNNVIRGQVAKIVVIAAQWSPPLPGLPTFSDVPQSNPFYTYVETAYCYGAISGYADGTFRPFNSATRGQISKVIYEASAGGHVCSWKKVAKRKPHPRVRFSFGYAKLVKVPTQLARPIPGVAELS